MPREELKKKREIQLKKRFLYHYLLLMIVSMFFYALYYTFYIYIKEISIYIFVGIIFFLISYVVLKNFFNTSKILIYYLFFAPLYNFYLMIIFGSLSFASFAWFIPLPLVSFLFLNKKMVLYFTIYAIALMIISAVCLFNGFLSSFSLNLTRKEILIADTFLIIFNTFLVYFIVNFKNKLYNIKIDYAFEQPKQYYQSKDESSSEDLMLDDIFFKIQVYIEKNSSYKNQNFSLSKLSYELDSNSTYISKAIKKNGFLNFNHFLNTYRVGFVKNLLDSADLGKITLFYIYSEAGFSNQSTFNRVFKQIEGITPSEYISKNKLK